MSPSPGLHPLKPGYSENTEGPIIIGSVEDDQGLVWIFLFLLLAVIIAGSLFFMAFIRR